MISIAYLKKNKERYYNEAARLTANGREDDAILAKVRANVFDIFLKTSALKAGDKTEKVFNHLKIKWTEDLALAEKYNDTATAAIKQIKLAVLTEIEDEVKRNG